MSARLFNAEMKQWLRENVKGRSPAQLAEDFNKRFKTNFLVKQIDTLKGGMKLRSGIDTKFKKGQSPANKGKKMSDEQRAKCEKYWFKKGHKRTKAMEIGDEYIDFQGYTIVKVADKKWRGKQRVVWEQHYGPIPKGYVIVFLDCNTRNCNIENLRMVKRSTLIRLCSYKLRSKIPEATEAGIKVIEMLDEINEKQKELQKQ